MGELGKVGSIDLLIWDAKQRESFLHLYFCRVLR